MAVKLKLIDITKLKKASELVSVESKAVLSDAKAMLARQEEFLNNGGMDRQKLKAYLNSDAWSAKQKHKVREELVRFHDELKRDMAAESAKVKKELRVASQLLKQGKGKQQSKPVRKKRSGYL